MIKEAELQNAYMLGRQAAMEKLAFDPRYVESTPDEISMPGPGPIMSMPEAEQSFMGSLTPENLALFEAIAAEKAQNQTPNAPRELSLMDRIRDAASNLVASNRADEFMDSPTPDVSALIRSAGVHNYVDRINEERKNKIFNEHAGVFMNNPTPEVRDIVDAARADNEFRASLIPGVVSNPMYTQQPTEESGGLDPMGLSVQGIVGTAKQQEFDQLSELQKQLAVARMIGLDPSMGSMAQNLSRAGILGGAAGGAALNPSLMGAGASLAGALGGGQVGGNIGRGINAALQTAGYGNMADKLIAAGGGLGGLAGGLGAGYATR